MPQPPRKRQRKPTFEERMQAIRETLEIVAGMQLTNERAIESNTKSIAQLKDAVAGLVRVAELQNTRIARLEGRS